MSLVNSFFVIREFKNYHIFDFAYNDLANNNCVLEFGGKGFPLFFSISAQSSLVMVVIIKRLNFALELPT